MNQRYVTPSTQRATPLARIFAKGIDVFVITIITVGLYPLGLLLSILYIALADAFKNGQSLGKKIVGLKVISVKELRSTCSIRQSIIRNLPLIVPLVFGLFPGVGPIFFFLSAPPLVLLELYLLFKLDSGNRLGDVMADTRVVTVHLIPDNSSSRQSDPQNNPPSQ